jgi:hypothetical protein
MSFVTVDCVRTRKAYSQAAPEIRKAIETRLRGGSLYRILGRVGDTLTSSKRVSVTNAKTFCGEIGLRLEEILLVRLAIVSPEQESLVGPFDAVFGNVAGSQGETEGHAVWVTIYPERSWYWVQKPALVQNGTWRVEAYFGNSETEDGHKFTIRACMWPDQALHTAQTLHGFPDGKLVSDVIHVSYRRPST